MDQERLWVTRALGGDQHAFACLVEAYQAPVFNLCYRMLGQATEAEDAAQETFVRVWSHLRSYKPEQKLSSWILAVASHYCVDRLRRRRVSWLSLDDLEQSSLPAGASQAPEETILEGEAWASVDHLLQSLPAGHRLVCILRYWQELSYAEIAEVVGSTESTVKSRLHRARRMLAAKLGDHHEFPASGKKVLPDGKWVTHHAVL